MSSHTRDEVKGPFSLGQIVPGAECDSQWIDLDATGHGGVATIVWRMENDNRSPHLEAFAAKVVTALNSHDDLLAELKLVEAHLHAYVEIIESGGGSASTSAARLASIRAVIAKARGGAV